MKQKTNINKKGISKEKSILKKEVQIFSEKRYIETKKRPAIEVKNLVIDFGESIAIDDITWDVPTGSMVTLLGPSGCGKTTTLNAIAGLLTPTSGQIYFKGKNVTKLTPKDRNIGLVFQNYALYPHMSVYKNIAFPLMNDPVWKAGVKKKNAYNKLLNDLILFKANGAPAKKLSVLEMKFFDIYDVKAETIAYLESTSIEVDVELEETKINLKNKSLTGRRRLSDLTNKTLEELKNNKKDFDLKKKNAYIKYNKQIKQINDGGKEKFETDIKKILKKELELAKKVKKQTTKNQK